MTFDEAVNVLTRVAADYRGTLEEHKILQAALNIIKSQDEQKDPVTHGEVTNETDA